MTVIYCSWCLPDSAGSHEDDCPANPKNPPSSHQAGTNLQGWVCPNCGVAYAPWVSACGCGRIYYPTVATANTLAVTLEPTL